MNTINNLGQSLPIGLILVDAPKSPGFTQEEIENDAESNALESIVGELSQRIFEFAESATSGQSLSVHISPSFQNFGSLAQITVIRKIPLTDIDRDAGKLSKPGMDKCEFESLLLRPSVSSARAGCSPRIFAFAIDLGDHKVTGTITLYVGIKQAVKVSKRCG